MRIHSPRDVALRAAEIVTIGAERLAHARRPARPGAYRSAGRCAPPACPFEAFRDRDATISLIRRIRPESIAETIALADDVRAGRIPIFSGSHPFGRPIDWHLDCRSGKRAPLKFYRDISFLDAAAVGDCKYTWELNRHNYLVSLGQAYWYTGNRRYYDAWKECLRSWIAANPYNVGINWASSLELAIRAVNWVWSAYFFAEELGREPELLAEMCEALRLHATHIERHLSYVFSPNTHLTGEALGLLYIGTSFPFMERAPRWAALGRRILAEELPKHILPDGAYFEMATYYHKYTIDFYIHYLALSGGPGAVGPDAVEPIRRMVLHLLMLAEPDGTIPLIGDSDGGQLLFLSREKNTIRGSCAAAAALLSDDRIKGLCGPDFPAESIWLVGPDGAARYREIPEAPPPSHHALNLDAGLYRFRSRRDGRDTSVLIDCGPHGWKACGHAHADLLSFEWVSDGVKVIADPGTLTYVRPLRDVARSSQSHNTISVNDLSQSIPGAAFRWERIAHPKYAEARAAGEAAFFAGEHDGYERFGCRHQRSALFFGGELVLIVDLLTLERELSTFLLNLQCGPGEVLPLGETLFQYAPAGGGRARYIGLFHAGGLRSAVDAGEVYPDYGSAAPAPRIRLTGGGISDSLIVVTALSADETVARSMRFERGGRFAAEGCGSRYALEIRSFGYSETSRRIEAELAASGETREGFALFARRTGSIPGAAGGALGLGGAAYGTLVASLRDGALVIDTDTPPREFACPVPLLSLSVNGAAREFRQRGGGVTVLP